MNLVLGTMTFGESVFLPDAKKFTDIFLNSGFSELDTAFVYNNGDSERILGEILSDEKRPFKVSTKVNPRVSGKLDKVAAFEQLNESLKRMDMEKVDIFYLHFPDPAVPVQDVLEACNTLYQEGKFKELGLSNFPAWMVSDIWHICHKNGWVLPTVYEGIYNPLTRKAENELNDCLNHFNMRFYAFNPLAGGLLSGKYSKYEEDPSDGRFTHRPNYQKRYWKKSYFDAVEVIKRACEKENISIIDAVYRWLAYHSMLDNGRGDSIIIGASKLNHLKQNIQAVNGGPLPQNIVDAFEEAWNICKADSPEYFTLYKGKGSVGGESK